MKILSKNSFGAFILFVAIETIFVPITDVYAATTPDLGQAASFAILSSTYTNSAIGTTINGDLGYTNGPVTAPTVNGSTFSPPAAKYSAAGTDQGAALTNLNSQPCSFTFPAGAVDLSTDASHGTIGVYLPGIYCTTATSSATVGAAGINLTGSGTFIFRINGALTTAANSVVTLSGGASACDVFWTPTAATTLGATSTFAGTDIDDSGITIGTTVTWTGRALTFGETASSTTDTISAPTCAGNTSGSSGSGSSSGSQSSLNGVPTSVCPPIDNQVAPNIITSKRVSPSSVFISWGPYSGQDTFNVQYGFENGKWLYSTDVTGFQTTINNLPTNQSIWIQIATRSSCRVGVYGNSRLVGSPSLPNSGIDPTGDSSWTNTIDNTSWWILFAQFMHI